MNKNMFKKILALLLLLGSPVYADTPMSTISNSYQILSSTGCTRTILDSGLQIIRMEEGCKVAALGYCPDVDDYSSTNFAYTITYSSINGSETQDFEMWAPVCITNGQNETAELPATAENITTNLPASAGRPVSHTTIGTGIYDKNDDSICTNARCAHRIWKAVLYADPDLWDPGDSIDIWEVQQTWIQDQ